MEEDQLKKRMKTNLTIYKDGINEEKFDDLECFDSDKEIENYAKSALGGIFETMLQMRIKVPKESLSIILENYGQYCREEWQESIKRLQIEKDESKENYLIDDIISLLRDAKDKINMNHQNHYNILKIIVLESCQMEDPNVL